MSGNKSWLPRREDALANLIAIWQVKLATTSLQTAYGWVAAECTATIATMTAFLTARAAYQNVPAHPNHTAKAEARAAAEEAMRKFARERVRYNNKMTDAQREELGVPTRDPEPTPVPVPVDGPASTIETSAKAPGVVRVRYVGPKPYGVDWVEIAWGVSDTPIKTAELLPHTETFSHNPWERLFDDGERGRRLYYALRYRTKEGPSHWSDVRDVLVP
jgi:hypothetical protein